ncbi:methyl-accepting chemotaxis protein [Photobacterium sanguinicancri]|uniref:methyl-accepting chemotaxis protein n=1 Tax=Photobacterium sanguinicancri TaxID=875932 RepID=UPI0026E34932|nr:methyl-accepting chemotaxis protein [Photobacterium sanguinicancri]
MLYLAYNTYLLTYLPTYLLTYLPTYLLTYLPTYLLSTDIDQLVAAMTALNKDINEIESVVTEIGGIAGQTNLLALNAAIVRLRVLESRGVVLLLLPMK